MLDRCSTFVRQSFDVHLTCGILARMPKALPVLDTTAPVCCATLSAGPMSLDDALEVALRLKALADPVRVRLLSLVIAEAEQGVCTCDLAPAVGVTEATASHHLKQLREAGLVEGTRKGTNVFYRPRTEALSALCRVLDPSC
jgi:ArsR family transcriptional regulator, arsenate/arsenite/antimonite-responsive transcriptional repressor